MGIKNWTNVNKRILKISRKTHFHFGFNAGLTLPLQHSWYIVRWNWFNVEAILTQSCKFDVVVSPLWRLWEINAVVSMCNKVVNIAFIIPCELKLLSSIEVTLKQHCNFDLVASTLLQRCILAVRRSEQRLFAGQRLVWVWIYVPLGHL